LTPEEIAKLVKERDEARAERDVARAALTNLVSQIRTVLGVGPEKSIVDQVREAKKNSFAGP
jgi:hypothetical protein